MNTILADIEEVLHQSKLYDINKYNSRETEMFEHIFIATGTSLTHIQGVAKKITLALKSKYGFFSKIDGYKQSEWILITTSNIQTNLLISRSRERYDLESIFAERYDSNK